MRERIIMLDQVRLPHLERRIVLQFLLQQRLSLMENAPLRLHLHGHHPKLNFPRGNLTVGNFK